MKEKITIGTCDGDIEVEANIFGPLAVHPAYKFPGFSVTHIQSGRCVNRHNHAFVNESDAFEFAKILSKEDWDMELSGGYDLPKPKRGSKGKYERLEILSYRELKKYPRY